MNQLLRNQLKFKGFIITDNMGMGAVAKNFSDEELLLGPIRAGADLVLIHSDRVTDKVLAACEKNIFADKDLQTKIETAYDRMEAIRKKWKMGKVRGNQPRLTPKSISLAQKIADRSIAVIRDPKHLLPATEARYPRILILSPQAGDGFHVALRSNFGYFETEIKRRFVDSDLSFFSDRPNAQEIRQQLSHCAEPDLIVLTLHEEPGTHGVAEEKMNLFRSVLNKFGNKTVVAGMVSPLFLKRLPKKGAAIFSFSAMPASQTALARAVVGELKSAGRSPVKL